MRLISLILITTIISSIRSINIHLDQNLCGFKFENYSIQWAYEPHSKNVVFVLKHKINTNSFLTGIGIGDRKKDFVDYIGVFLKNGQIGIADTNINSKDGKIIPDSSTNVQSIAFDYTNEILTAKFARSLISPDDKHDHSLDGCQILNFPVKGGSISRSGIVIDFDEMVEKQICNIDKNCIVDLKAKDDQKVTKNDSKNVKKEDKVEISHSVDISGTGDPCSFAGVGYTVNWTYNPSSEMVDFVMKHPIKQGKWWSAVGIGDTMADMDIAIMFISSGRPKRIRDYFSSSYSVPTEDKKNDWILSRQRTKSIDGMIELGFSRKLETGNNDDDRSLDGCVLFQFAANGGRYGSGFSVQKHDDWPDLYKACDIKNKCIPKESSKRQEPSLEENNDGSVEELSIDETDEEQGNGKKKGKNRKNRKHRTTTVPPTEENTVEATTAGSLFGGLFGGGNQGEAVVEAAGIDPSSTLAPLLEAMNQIAISTTMNPEGLIESSSISGLQGGEAIQQADTPQDPSNEIQSSEASPENGFETTFSMSFASGSASSEIPTIQGDQSTVAGEMTSISPTIEGASSASDGTTTIQWTMGPDFSPMFNGELNTSAISADELRTAPPSGEVEESTTVATSDGTSVAGMDPGNLPNSHLLLAGTDSNSGENIATTPLTLTTILSGSDSTSFDGLSSDVVPQASPETPLNVEGATPMTLTTILAGSGQTEALLNGASGEIGATMQPKNDFMMITFGSGQNSNSEATTVAFDGSTDSTAMSSVEGSTIAPIGSESVLPVGGSTIAPIGSESVLPVEGSTLAPVGSESILPNALDATAGPTIGGIEGITGNPILGNMVSEGTSIIPIGVTGDNAVSVESPTTLPGLALPTGSLPVDIMANNGGLGSTPPSEALPVIGFGQTTPAIGSEQTVPTMEGGILNESPVPVGSIITGEATTMMSAGLTEVSGETGIPTSSNGPIIDPALSNTISGEITQTTAGGLFGGLFGSGVTVPTNNETLPVAEGSTVAPGSIPLSGGELSTVPVADVTSVVDSVVTTTLDSLLGGLSTNASIGMITGETGSTDGVDGGTEATLPTSGVTGDSTTLDASQTTVETVTLPPGVAIAGGSSETPLNGGATLDLTTIIPGDLVTDQNGVATLTPLNGVSGMTAETTQTTAGGFWSGLGGILGGSTLAPLSDVTTGSTGLTGVPNTGDIGTTIGDMSGVSTEVSVITAAPSAEVTGSSLETEGSGSVAPETGTPIPNTGSSPGIAPSGELFPSTVTEITSNEVQVSSTESSIISEEESASGSTELIEGSGQESSEATTISVNDQSTPLPGPLNTENIVNTLGEEAVGNPAEGCGVNHEDFSLCSGYFNDYLSRVQQWAKDNSEEMDQQYEKACVLLKKVNNVPSLCCKIYYDTCKGHIEL